MSIYVFLDKCELQFCLLLDSVLQYQYYLDFIKSYVLYINIVCSSYFKSYLIFILLIVVNDQWKDMVAHNKGDV